MKALYPSNLFNTPVNNRQHSGWQNHGPHKVLFILLAALISFVIRSNAQAPAFTIQQGIPTGGSSALNAIAYGNGKYITAGNYSLTPGLVYISSDGDNWSRVIDAGIPADMNFTGGAYGNGVFVLVGNSTVTTTQGLIIKSSNGTSWSSSTSGTTNNISNLAFLNGAFYAVGSNGTFLKSTDGASWTTITVNGASADYFMHVTYGNGVFAIGGRTSGSSETHVYRSSTAASNSWSFVNISAANSLNKICFLKDKFYVFSLTSNVYTSADAASWSEITSASVSLPTSGTTVVGYPNQMFGGVYDGTKISMYGSSQVQSYCSVITSATSGSYTMQPKSVGIISQNMAYLNGKYFILGNEGITSSTDGINYKYPSGSYFGLASNGTNYVMVGSTSSSEGAIYTSTNWTTWSNKTPGFVSGAFNGVCYANSKYVAVGNTGVVARSADGNTWTTGTADDITSSLKSVTYGNGKYVAVGNQGKITYSTDGITWTQANKDAATGSNFYAVKYLNNYFIAVGGSVATTGTARVAYSANGINWTENSPAITGHIVDVAYNGSKYVFVGKVNSATATAREFMSVTSTNITTSSYSSQSIFAASNTGNVPFLISGVGAMTYSNGRFVVIGNQGATPFNAYVLTSTDGIAWTAYDAGTTMRQRAVVAEGDNFKIACQGDGKITAAFSAVLPLNWISFTAQKLQGNVQLEWKTANEQHTKDFVVERSNNGSLWKSADTVKANGTVSNSYSFTDHAAFEGANYYRIAQRDLDNKATYSKVINVWFTKAASTIQVYPNPATGNMLNLSLQHAATIRIYSTTGALMTESSMAAGLHQVRTEGWAKGKYFLHADGETLPIVIQ